MSKADVKVNGVRTVLLVAGARPNFMKIAPLWGAFQKGSSIRPVVVHTGQHYDEPMSDVFFADLALPEPNVILGVGSGTHAVQTGLTMIEFEKTCLEFAPSAVVVVGDVNATLACSLCAAKLGIPVAHVEAGLRSGDRSMPEEINRLVTDQLADWLYAPSTDAVENLIREGIPEERIVMVGNVMIDSLMSVLPRTNIEIATTKFGLQPGQYCLLTLHRPSNVDDAARLIETLRTLQDLDLPLFFPVHPRTRKRLDSVLKTSTHRGSLSLSDPLRYVDFLSVMRGAALVITDSGGIQEETTYLGIPCLTLRETTERPITISIGTNQLTTLATMGDQVSEILNGKVRKGSVPPYWDGRSAERIREHLVEAMGDSVLGEEAVGG